MALLRNNVTPWNRTTIFFVHGIGFQPVQYSKPLYDILYARDPAMVDATRWYEVVYDQANDEMKHKIVELQKRIPTPGSSPGAMDLAADFLLDLVDYLITNSLYNWINTIFRKALLDALALGNADGVLPGQHRLIVISHSLGTVVSYELLHKIINDAQVPGLSSGVKIQAWLTMGSPLAFIKAKLPLIPHINFDTFLRDTPIGRPTMEDPFVGKVSNVVNWFNYRQKWDPVGSLVPLNQVTANGALSKETSVFEAFHTGPNPHDFANYITEYAGDIMGIVRG